jgi:hypothetical protein
VSIQRSLDFTRPLLGIATNIPVDNSQQPRSPAIVSVQNRYNLNDPKLDADD